MNQSDSNFAQGIKLGLRGKYREAIDKLSDVVEREPHLIVAHTSLGVAFHKSGEDDRALICYDTALRLDPKYAEAHYFRANIFYTRKNIPQGIAGYTIAIGLKPELIEAHRKPIPQDRLTDYTQSPAEMYWIFKPAHHILKLNETLKANPQHAAIFIERASAYFALWNYEQAIADYSASLAINPANAQVVHFRGLAYEQLREFDHALKDYEQAIAMDSQFSDAYINRGVTFGKIGNFQQSIASLTEGIRLSPTNLAGYFNRGTAYFQQENFEKAIADFSQVLQYAPEDEAAYYWRGRAHEKTGLKKNAIADYQRFLQLSKDPAAKQEVEQKLSQLLP